MKKWCVFLCITLTFIFSFSIAHAAENNIAKNPYEAYGLCVVSKVMDYDKHFDMQDTVDKETYNKILEFWFDKNPENIKNPTNADAVCFLSDYAPNTKIKGFAISEYKDFGFIKKNHRASYSKMCKAGYLTGFENYLRPYYPLTYENLFVLLMNFETHVNNANNLHATYGMITDSYSEGKNIVLKQSVNNKEKTFSFSRLYVFYIQNENDIYAYSYNLKRGTYAKIYTLNDEIIFVSIPKEESKLDNNLEILNARIFLCNEYDSQIIFINSVTNNYMTYSYDKNILVYENKQKKSLSDINNIYVDRYAYFILDNTTNTIKYINIVG